MTALHSNFRQRLLAGDLLIGTFVKTPSMMLAEVLGQTSLDVLCLDAEHSPFDRRDIDTCVMALRSARKPSLVRVSSFKPEHILNALDCGATGIVVPHVDSKEKAQACADSARFGDGGRGYAGSTRAAAYGRNGLEDNLATNQSQTVVVAQIEDLAALDCIDEIAAVEGIDCLFIGMMDLMVALKATSLKDSRVMDAAKTICNAARACNRRLGIFVSDIGDVPFWRSQGVSLFLLQSDHYFIQQGATQLVAQIDDVRNDE